MAFWKAIGLDIDPRAAERCSNPLGERPPERMPGSRGGIPPSAVELLNDVVLNDAKKRLVTAKGGLVKEACSDAAELFIPS